MAYSATPSSPYPGPNPLSMTGHGTQRGINVSGGKLRLPDNLTIKKATNYQAGDDFSGIGLLTGKANGIHAAGLKLLGLHVGARGAAGYDQTICLDQPLIDAQDIGQTQDWVFGILTEQRGGVIIRGGEMIRGGSHTNPNKSHRLYLAPETGLSLTGLTCRENWAGRDVQVYGGDGSRVPPAYWYIGDCIFERLLQPVGQHGTYASVQTNPLIESVIERTAITSDYCCIEAQGDVHIKGGHLSGAGVGVRAMRDGIRIRLSGVDNRCPTKVDTQGFRNVRVITEEAS